MQWNLEDLNKAYSKYLKDIEAKEKKLNECEKTKKCDLKTTYSILGADVTIDKVSNTKSSLAKLKKDAEAKKKTIDSYVKDIKQFEKKSKLNVNDRLDMGDIKMEFADLKMNYQTFIGAVNDGEKRFAEVSAKVDATLLGHYVKAAVDKATNEKTLCEKVNQCSSKAAKKVFETEIKPFNVWKAEISGNVNQPKQDVKDIKTLTEPSEGVQ